MLLVMNIWLLTNKNEPILISPEDQHLFISCSIYKHSNTCGYERYILGKHKLKGQSISRYIMNYYGEHQVDHANHETWDNRRCNLRVATASQNANNKRKIHPNSRSTLKGLYISPRGEIKWAVKGFLSKNYFSQKFAYSDYVDFKRKTDPIFFYFEPIESLPLEKVIPRKARIYKNKSGMRGVYIVTKNKKNRYTANFGLDGKKTRIGTFDTLKEAAKAYDRVAFDALGFDAFLNFPEEYTIFL